MARHHLDLNDANLLSTRSYRLAVRACKDAINERSMVAVYGEAGCGKTFAIENALEQHNEIENHLLDLPMRPSPRGIAARLIKELTGTNASGPLYELDEQLVELLTATPRLLVFDEAQRLTLDGIEYLRHLHDAATRKRQQTGCHSFGLVFAGGHGCYQTLQRYPMLASRISTWVEFAPLKPEETASLLPAFHPVLTDADPDVIELIDDGYAHGVLRNWATFTKRAADFCAQLGVKTVDERISRNVFGQKPQANAYA